MHGYKPKWGRSERDLTYVERELTHIDYIKRKLTHVEGIGILKGLVGFSWEWANLYERRTIFPMNVQCMKGWYTLSLKY